MSYDEMPAGGAGGVVVLVGDRSRLSNGLTLARKTILIEMLYFGFLPRRWIYSVDGLPQTPVDRHREVLLMVAC